MDIAGMIGKAVIDIIKDHGKENHFKMVDIKEDANVTKRLYVIDGDDISEDSKFMFSAFAILETETVNNGDGVYDYYLGLNRDDSYENFESNLYMWVELNQPLIKN